MKSEKYLAWVRQQPCIHCARPAPSEPHHIKHIGYFSGAGMKAPDYLAMPLCGSCHRHVHRDPEMWGMQYPWVLRTLLLAFEEGVLCEG